MSEVRIPKKLEKKKIRKNSPIKVTGVPAGTHYKCRQDYPNTADTDLANSQDSSLSKD